MTENEAKEILTLSDEMKKELPNLKKVYEVAVNALSEIQQYRELGTVEELREAREKQKAKKGISSKSLVSIHNECPTCGYNLFGNIPSTYCPNCGQCIDWGEEE